MQSPHPPRMFPAAMLPAVILAPLVVRVLLLVEGESAIQPPDLHGMTADLGVSLILATGIVAAAKIGSWFRVAAVFLVAFWCLLNFANYEHIRELGAMAGFSHAGYVMDPTFFRGSVLAPTHPLLLALTVVTAAVFAWIACSPGREAPVLRLFLLGVAMAAAAVVIPPSDAVASWRQANFLVAQTERLFGQRPDRATRAAIGLKGLAEKDLEGDPMIRDEHRAQNLLLIVLEGVSGAYLPSFREHHAFPALFDMPELDRIAQQGISYPSFIATQRQTNRGEFALLCGEYPKLLTAEAHMSELAGQGPLDCLPAVMRDAGFSTVYLQAAPMPFMLKDQFMLQAGFARTYGDDWFKRSYNRNNWGVDDRAFFEESLEMIEELSREPAPWFLTLLTVGTHHRYNVPPSFEGTHEAGTAAWAFEYLDHAIGDFIRRLEASGVLDDTLVLITSDESQATISGAPDAVNMLGQGWGFLIALLPSRETGEVGETFVQPDLPLSVADYFGLVERRPAFAGRSVFRRYDRNREVFWGNTHLGMVAGLTLDKNLIICSEDFSTCGGYLLNGKELFVVDTPKRFATAAEVEWLYEAAQKSLITNSGHLNTRRYSLISRGPHPIIPVSGEQYVFGGQFVSLPAQSTADVAIEVAVEGASGWVDLVHNFMVNFQLRYARTVRVNAGETLRLRYAVNTQFELDDVECRLWITDFQGEDLHLVFATADLRIAPLSSAQPAAEIVERTFEVSGRAQQ